MTLPPDKPSRPSPPGRWWRRRAVLWSGAGVLVLLLAAVGLLVLRPYWRLSSKFEDITFRQPSRLYARPVELAEGRPYSLDRLLLDLRSESYREAGAGEVLPPGRFRKAGDGLRVHLRSFPTPDGKGGGGILEVSFKGSRIQRLALNGRTVEKADLEPPLLASYYGEDLLERRPVGVDEVAEDLIESVVAAEDDSFFSHGGVSPSGMLRAVWVNLRGGQIKQGGSTLTQQLVKNLYLTQRRTMWRKSQELVLALMLELRYSKREILAAYLNEIYLGTSGGVNLMGVGAASRAYFGKDASQLDLAESAVLAGMIRAPGAYSPLTHPDRARERRDWVLHRLEALGRVDKNRIASALASPVAVSPEPVVRRRAPYFADAMAAEAARRYEIDDLADGGYALFSTLSWRDQQAAQAAVDTGLAAAAKGYERASKAPEPLQAALISLQPETGGILAYLGGRRYEQSQFDRVSQALRQSGSTFKPIVYAAAFESHRASPATFLEDEPLTVQMGRQTWTPKNDDGDVHGWVTARTALEHSYNLATARLALQVGMPRIVALAHGMGITTAMDPFPAVALGATSLSPLELATAYATLASGGVRPPVHGLVAILDRHGKRAPGGNLPPAERALSPQANYLVTSLLQGVLERGTGAGVDPQLRGVLAGKTGTTNERRDSWFAGYSSDRATVVWVGYDDNSVTRLSGARAALPIWSRFTVSVAPPGGYSTFPQPPGLTTAVIDPESGMLATEYCPAVFTEYFRPGEVPTELCNLHQDFGNEQQMGAQRLDEEAPRQPLRPSVQPPRPRGFRQWLRRLFGGGGGGGGEDEANAGEAGPDSDRDRADHPDRAAPLDHATPPDRSAPLAPLAPQNSADRSSGRGGRRASAAGRGPSDEQDQPPPAPPGY